METRAQILEVRAVAVKKPDRPTVNARDRAQTRRADAKPPAAAPLFDPQNGKEKAGNVCPQITQINTDLKRRQNPASGSDVMPQSVHSVDNTSQGSAPVVAETPSEIAERKSFEHMREIRLEDEAARKRKQDYEDAVKANGGRPRKCATCGQDMRFYREIGWTCLGWPKSCPDRFRQLRATGEAKATK